ncbi:MAG: 7-cyano-7-deazaguanine synthase [Nitrososphaerota archaeon]
MARAVALFSGGIDSTTLVWKLKAEGWELILLSFNTYRRNPREIAAADNIARLAHPLEYLVQDLGILREIYDFPSDQRLAIDMNLKTPPTILIPYKNIVYYSLAAHLASQLGATVLAGGHTLEDQSTLPDASRKYLNNVESLLNESLSYPRIRLITPLIGMSKPQIVRLGVELGAPLQLTWSCWATGEVHCGTCVGCLNRIKAFREAGVADGTEYLAWYSV